MKQTNLPEKSNQPIQEAPTIRETKQENALLFVNQCIKFAMQLMGHKNITEADYELTVHSSLSLIQEKYSYYNENEVLAVFKMGGMGEITDKPFMSTRTVAEWFKIYHNDMKRPRKPQKPKPKQLAIGKQSREEIAKHLLEIREIYMQDEVIISGNYEIGVKEGFFPLLNPSSEKVEKARNEAKREISQRERKPLNYPKEIEFQTNQILKRQTLLLLFKHSDYPNILKSENELKEKAKNL